MRTIHPQPNHHQDCTSSEQALLTFIRDADAKELAKALLEVHHMALYHSDVPIEGKEKLDLLYVKLLAEALSKL